MLIKALLTAVCLFLLSATACVTHETALLEYEDAIYFNPSTTQNDLTVLCILVDGLSEPRLKENLNAGKAEAIREFFLTGAGSLHQGRVLFPSQTYPSIASLLTASPIDAHPIIGNQMRLNGHFVNFETPQARGDLNNALEKLSVFSSLQSQNLKSISLAHYFRSGATVHYRTDIEAGLEYLSGDFASIDEKIILSLNAILKEVPLKQWPTFIFTHVIGVDSVSHEHGPQSQQSENYLAQLDRQLRPTFDLLRQAEAKGKKLTVILTSDHGFTRLDRYFDVEKWVKSMNPNIKVLNQTRYASLYLPTESTRALEDSLIKEMATQPDIEIFAERLDDEIRFESTSVSAVIKYKPASCPKTPYALNLTLRNVPTVDKTEKFECPEAFDHSAKPFYAPFLVSNLASYFHSRYHPDAILIPASHVTFSNDQKGGHGGLTPEEIFVPVLLHNAKIKNEELILPTYELLKPLKSGG